MEKIIRTGFSCFMVMTFFFIIVSCKEEQTIPNLSDFSKTQPENVRLENLSSSRITVAWDRIDDAASYTVELLTSKDSDTPVDEYTTISGDQYSFTTVDEIVGYYVRVRANFNTVENPVLGDWVYVLDGQSPGRIMPKYGFVDEDFEEPEPEAEEVIYPNFPEGFEEISGARKGSYTSTDPETYPTGEWEMYRTYTTNSGTALLHKVGTYAAMLSPNIEGYVAMSFDLPYGASRLTFVTGSATRTNANDVNNMPITLSVFYSTDGGNSWNKIDDILIDDVEVQHTPEYDNLGIEGPVRFKFQKDDGIARPIVDEIAVYYLEN